MWDNDRWTPTSVALPGGNMGSKDKGGKNTKTAAAKNLKEKRQDKKAKRTAADAKRDRTV
ncbi:MAG TPA: hypothetical protein VJR05_12945 [Acidimicrobiia bacterium]|nr:hypothetical protein [Acidimicrobiia bacterium]